MLLTFLLLYYNTNAKDIGGTSIYSNSSNSRAIEFLGYNKHHCVAVGALSWKGSEHASDGSVFLG